MGKILTVSIASYNVEKFLRQTLSSFVIDEERMDALEVIVVSDGSKDGTVQIAEEFVRKYPNTFRLIDKDNGGYGSTINASLKAAQGKYYKLVDGDDWVEKNGLSKLIDFLKLKDSDMVLSKYCTCEEGTGKRVVIDEGLVFDNKEHKIEYLFEHSIPMHFIAYKTEILRSNQIRITENCFYTDLEFVIKPLPYIESVSLLDEVVYVYRVGRDEQSVSIKSWQKNIDQATKVSCGLARYYESIKGKIIDGKKINYVRSKVVDSAVNKYRIFLSFKRSDEVYRKMNEFTINLEESSREVAALSKENNLVKLLLLPGQPLYGLLSVIYRKHLKRKGMI